MLVEEKENTVDEMLLESTNLTKDETKDNLTKEKPAVKEDSTDDIIDGIETTGGDERGKFTFKSGDSVYFGDTKKELIETCK